MIIINEYFKQNLIYQIGRKLNNFSKLLFIPSSKILLFFSLIRIFIVIKIIKNRCKN